MIINILVKNVINLTNNFMNTHETEELSKCCGKPKEVSTADEGTACYVCSKCKREFIPAEEKQQSFSDFIRAENSPEKEKIMMDVIKEANQEQKDLMEKPQEGWEKLAETPQWGAWKIVSDMLDKPNEFGIYPTSECYKKLYDFVCEREAIAQREALKKVGEAVLKLQSCKDPICKSGYDHAKREVLQILTNFNPKE